MVRTTLHELNPNFLPKFPFPPKKYPRCRGKKSLINSIPISQSCYSQKYQSQFQLAPEIPVFSGEKSWIWQKLHITNSIPIPPEFPVIPKKPSSIPTSPFPFTLKKPPRFGENTALQTPSQLPYKIPVFIKIQTQIQLPHSRFPPKNLGYGENAAWQSQSQLPAEIPVIPKKLTQSQLPHSHFPHKKNLGCGENAAQQTQSQFTPKIPVFPTKNPGCGKNAAQQNPNLPNPVIPKNQTQSQPAHEIPVFPQEKSWTRWKRCVTSSIPTSHSC